MGNSRVKGRFALALDGKQVLVLVVGAIVLVGAVFVLGMNIGRRSMVAAAVATPVPTLAAAKDPLARLDEPLPVREDPAVELQAHQVLTDARPIDKAFPVPAVKAPEPPPPPVPVAAAVAPPTSDGAEPKVAPRPRPRAEPSKKRGAYAIQVASLSRRSDAEKVAHRHRTRSPRIVQADVPGKGRHYRVLLGAFETPDAARRALASLTRSGVQGIVTAVR